MEIKKIILVSDAAFDQCLEDCESWLPDDEYIVLNEKEVAYLKDLICQQNDSHELVHSITKKFGCYITTSEASQASETGKEDI